MTPDTTSAATAIQSLQNFANAAEKLTNLANSMYMGPFTASASCGGQTYTIQFPSMALEMEQFVEEVTSQGGLVAILNEFDDFFQPLQNWFLNSLPSVTTIINSIAESDSSNLGTNISNAINAINQLKADLDDGMTNLGNWAAQVQGSFSQIQYNCNLAETRDFDMDTDYLNQNYGSWCGLQDLLNSHSVLKIQVDMQLQFFYGTLAEYGITTDGINQNLAFIYGPLITLQNDLNQVQTDLNTAAESTNDIIQKFAANESVSSWDTLIQFVSGEFSSGS